MSHFKKIICIIFSGVLLGTASLVSAALTSESPETIQNKYKNGEVIQVLIVPGHDNQFSGALFKKEREADMTLVVARKIEEYLRKDAQVSVVVARGDEDYIKPIRNYFESQTFMVNHFIKSHAAAMRKEIASGKILVPKQVPHGNASKIPMYRLYAMNKWATEQKFDLVLHLHFNDEGDRSLNTRGKFSGYSVYVPDSNLLGAPVSKDLGTAVAKRLKKYFDLSTMPYEYNHADAHGVISDMKLIALGANKTIAIPRVLIEYAYIYEPIVSPEKFEFTSDMMAAATADGINDFLWNVQ